MRAKLGLSLLFAFLFLAARPIHAQTAAAPAIAPTPWSASPIGTYDLVADAHGEPHPATLTITDSAGTTHAVIVADNESHRMKMTVKGVDLVLETDTPNGPMSVILQRRGNEVTGTWSRVDKGGAITGKLKP